MAWFLAFTPHALLHGSDPFVTTLLDHPAIVDLGANTSVPLLGVLAAPVTLTLGPIAALNLLLRLSLFSSAAATYLLARRFCRSEPAPFLAGAVYAFGPYLAAHASPGANVDLVLVPIPPLLLLVLDDLLRRQQRGPIDDGLLLGALAGAQVLIDPEVLADLTIACVAVAIVALLAAPRRLARQLVGLRRRIALAAAAALPVAGLLAAAPLWALLAAPGHLRGPIQPVATLQSFHLDLAELVLAPARQLLDTSALAAAGRAAVGSSSLGAGPEHGGYLGVPLLLLAVALAAAWWREAVLRLAAVLALVALVLALGPRLEITHRLSLLPLPEALLAHLPLLDSTIPARFGLELVLGLAIVLAVGLDRTLTAWAGLRLRRVALLAASTFALVCYLPAFPFGSKALPPEQGVLTALRRDVPSGAVVLTYPYALPPYDEAMLWQARDSMRVTLMGGYATIAGPRRRSGAQYWPPLLDPPSVQEILERDETGRSLHYPRPKRPVLGAGALCAFVNRYGVGAVVMRLGRLVPDQAGVERAFVAALGRPLRVGRDALVWRDVRRACDDVARRGAR